MDAGAASSGAVRGRLLAKAARLLVLGACTVAIAGPAPAAEGSAAAAAAALSLQVTFFPNGTIAVTLPDGTPVGTTSGAPTVIPAGAYTVVMSGPGGCTQSPLFDLKGSGVAIVTDMNGGEVDALTYNAFFAPNTTYTWRTDNVNPNIVHTFVTSATVAATAAGQTGGSGTSTTHSGPTSEDIVGSAIAPYRGKLTAAVSAAGTLTLAYGGKAVTHLKAGRYRITVTDRSAKSGLTFEKARRALRVTGAKFVGTRTYSVELTSGSWLVVPRAGAKTISLLVS